MKGVNTVVEVTIEEGMATFEVKGLHKLWTFRGCVRVPVGNIRDVRYDPTAIGGLWKGWKFPGIYLPGVIVAGTFYRPFYRRGRKYFWDVSRPEKTIVVEIEGGPYDELIVDVDDPENVVSKLKAARDGAT